MSQRVFEDEALQAELERRLDLMTSPDFHDPAREDFTAGDFLALLALVVVVSLAFFFWGY